MMLETFLRGHETGGMDSAAGTFDRSSTPTVEAVLVKKTSKRWGRQLNGLEQRSSTTLSTLLLWIGWIATIFVQFICAILIGLYDVSHSDIVRRPHSPLLSPPVSIPSNVSL